jgi:nicotinate-nucleotide adenylyltransferase
LIDGFTAIFGGSFDPPHLGHAEVVSWLLARAGCSRVIIVPCFEHAFAKDSAPFEDRMEMCRLAFERFMDAVTVSDVESTLPVPSYTVNTILALHALFPADRLRLVIGSDILAETDRWKDFDRITELAPPLVLNRGGFPGGGVGNFPKIASSDIRERLAAGDDCSDMVDQVVLSYIQGTRLYGV